MKVRLLLLFAIGAMITANSVFAQITSLPTKQLGRMHYYSYEVQKKETIYGIAKKLNITTDDIIKYNPTVAEGLKAGQTLYFPVSDFATSATINAQKATSTTTTQTSTSQTTTTQNTPATQSVQATSEYTSHIVQKNETLFGLAKDNGISIDDIIRLNPSASDGIKSGDILRLPKTSSSLRASKQAATTSNTSKSSADNGNMVKATSSSASKVTDNSIIYHTLVSGESMFTLAKRYNTTTQEIQDLNPDINPTTMQIGQILKIRSGNGANTNDATDNGSTETPSSSNIGRQTDSNSINIAIVLPFDLKAKEVTRTADSYTEYYKGFLLAVDSIRTQTRKKINIYAFDSSKNFSDILTNENLKEMDAIIAPNDAEQLAQLTAFGEEYQIPVINNYIIKTNLYNNNKYFVQVNTPQNIFYDKVIEALNQVAGNYEYLFVCNKDTNNTKDIIDSLKAYLKYKKNEQYQELFYSKELQADDIDTYLLTGHHYMIVLDNPKSFVNCIEALKKIKDSRLDVDIALLGFPDWVSLKNEQKGELKDMDTYLYTRFYNDNTSREYARYYAKFVNTYGGGMLKAYPNMGVLGFDTGYFFLSQMIKYGKDFTKNSSRHFGIQNDFYLENVEGNSGTINTAVNIVHFTPYGITKISK